MRWVCAVDIIETLSSVLVAIFLVGTAIPVKQLSVARHRFPLLEKDLLDCLLDSERKSKEHDSSTQILFDFQ